MALSLACQSDVRTSESRDADSVVRLSTQYAGYSYFRNEPQDCYIALLAGHYLLLHRDDRLGLGQVCGHRWHQRSVIHRLRLPECLYVLDVDSSSQLLPPSPLGAVSCSLLWIVEDGIPKKERMTGRVLFPLTSPHLIRVLSYQWPTNPRDAFRHPHAAQYNTFDSYDTGGSACPFKDDQSVICGACPLFCSTSAGYPVRNRLSSTACACVPSVISSANKTERAGT